MKPRTLLIVLALLSAVTGGYFWQRHAAERPLDKVGAVRLAASLTLSAAPVWLAQDLGFFARAGLDATVQPSDTGKTATEAMLKGEVDLAPATEFKAIETSFTRKDVRILGTTSFMHNTRLLGLKVKGIAKPEDLKGKRIGVNFGTSGEYHLARLLVLHGMTRGDIAWVNLKPQAMADALADGRVDAVMVWSPFSTAIEQRFGERIASFDGQSGQDFYYVILGRQDWLAQHPKVAERLMLALKWATDWMAAHPAEARTYLATKFKIEPAAIDVEARGSRFDVGLPQALLSAMEAEGRWLQEQGTPGELPANSLDLIAFEPLLAVAPETVTMIRGRQAKAKD
jgi:NitT/TauT family transport system substrate-binding protein